MEMWNADSANTSSNKWDANSPLLLEANAGTGKTYSLVRIAYRLIMERGIDLDSLLILTFTKKAAREMKDRLRQLLLDKLTDNPSDEQRIRLQKALGQISWAQISTIHSFCYWVISRYPQFFQLPSHPELEDKEQVLRKLVVGFLRNEPLRDISAQNLESMSLKELMQVTRNVLGNEHDLLARYVYLSYNDQEEHRKALSDFQRTWAEKVQRNRYEYFQKSGTLSYDEIIKLMLDRLAAGEAGDPLLRALRGRFKAGIVDEFQDTDQLQWDIISRILPPHESTLVVIGDPKQSIYAFRGADLRVYQKVKKEIEKYGTLARLGTNFRTVGPLLEKVNRFSQIIFQNTPRGWGNLTYDEAQMSRACDVNQLHLRWAQSLSPVFSFLSVPSYGPNTDVGTDRVRDMFLECVVSKILQLVGRRVVVRGGADQSETERALDYGDFVILADTNDNLRQAFLKLSAHGIPSVIVGKSRLWDTQAALGILTLLRFLERPSDPRRRKSLLYSFWCSATLEEIEDNQSALNVGLEVGLSLGCKLYQEKKFYSLVAWVSTWSKNWPNKPLNESLGYRLITDVYHIVDKLTEAALRGELQYQTPYEWILKKIEESAKDVEPDDLRLDRSSRTVKMMTLHQSKGLEFPVVFLFYGLSASNPRYIHNSCLSIYRGESENLDRGMWCFASKVNDLQALAINDGNLLKENIAHDEVLERKRLWYVGLTRAQLACFVSAMGVKRSHITKEIFPLLGDILKENLETVNLSEKVEPGSWREDEGLFYRSELKERKRQSFSEPWITSYSYESSKLKKQPYEWKDEEHEKDEADSEEHPGDRWGGAWFGDLFHKCMQYWDWTDRTDGGVKDSVEKFLQTGEYLNFLKQLVPELWRNNLEEITGEIAQLMMSTITTPLAPLSVKLDELKKDTMRKEIPFLNYRDDESHFIKGVIDLLFTYNDSWYILDYKTDRLENYDPQNLQKAMEQNHYNLQAKFYESAVRKHIQSLRGVGIGGIFYLFVRGLDSSGRGIVFRRVEHA